MLADLDELVLRCRDTNAQRYVRDAVACYNSGAYRACIISTWISVVLDIIGKLHELDLSGDANAAKHLALLEQNRQKGDAGLRESLEFERNVLSIAADEFELLTPLEKEDLERLFRDRNKCAHPSLQSMSAPYMPSAEVARCHLRNSVEILLQREPVQGKAALDRIWTDIKSTYFPNTVADAKLRLQGGPLKRARGSLVRSVIIGLTKSFIHDDLPSSEHRRQLAAIGAVGEMHRTACARIFQEDVPRVFDGAPDASMPRLLAYLAAVPDLWPLLGEARQIKVRGFLNGAHGAELAQALGHAEKIPDLVPTVQKQMREVLQSTEGIDTEMLSHLIRIEPRQEYCEPASEAFIKSRSFAGAKDNADQLLLPLASRLSTDQLRRVLKAVLENDQIRGAWGIPDEVLPRLFTETAAHSDAVKQEWIAIYRHYSQAHLAEYYKDQTSDLGRLVESTFPGDLN